MQQITNELIKEFFDIERNNSGNIIDRWNNFLASKQAKDWEVVSYVDRDVMPHCTVTHAIIKQGHTKWNTAVVKNYEIWEVRRLPDNITFTVGEDIKGYGIIKRFNIDSNLMEVHFDTGAFIGLHSICKLPAKVKLFTTEDGKDIYESEEILFRVKNNFEIDVPRAWVKGDNTSWKWFAHRSAAEEYVREHKPCISRKQIRDVMEYRGTSPTADWIISEIDKQLNS